MCGIVCGGVRGQNVCLVYGIVCKGVWGRVFVLCVV